MKILNRYKQFLCNSDINAVLLSFFVSLLSIVITLLCLVSFPLWENQFSELHFSISNQMSILVTNRIISIKIAILVSVLIFHLMLFMFNYAKQRSRQIDAFNLVLYALFPVIFWLISALKNVSTEELYADWIFLSLYLVFFVLSIIIFEKDNKYSSEYIKCVITTTTLSLFAGAGLYTFLCYYKLLYSFDISWKQCRLLLLGLTIFLPIFSSVSYFLIREMKMYKNLICTPIMLAILLLYLLFIPLPFYIDSDLVNNCNHTKIILCIVLPLIVFGIINIFRYLFKDGSIDFSSLPVFIGGAIVLFFWANNKVYPELPYNLFEFSARFSPYDAYKHGYGELFKDYQVTYGFSDVCGYIFGGFFCSEYNLFSNIYGFSIFASIMLLAQYFAYRLVIPWYLAIFVLSLYMHISVPVIFFCLLLYYKVFENKIFWVFVWVLLAAFLPFFRVPLGTVAVVATIPILIYQLILLYKTNIVSFAKTGLVLSIILIISLFTSYWSYVYALVKMMLSFKANNQVWAGNLWLFSKSLSEVILGNCVIAVPLLAFLIMFLLMKYKQISNKKTILLLSFIAVIYSLLTLGYSFSRVDGNTSGRQYVILMSFFPLLYFSFATNLYNKKISGILCIIGAAIFCQFESKTPIQFGKSMRTISHFTDSDFIDGSKWGMPYIGKGLKGKAFDEQAIKELHDIKFNMNRILAPEETFLSLTQANLENIAAQRFLPIEYHSYFMFACELQEEHAIGRLIEQSVKVSVVRDDIHIDGQYVNTRGYYLYRFALSGNIPVKLGNSVYFMPEKYYLKANIPVPDKAHMLSALEAVPQTDNIGDHPINFGYNSGSIINTLDLRSSINNPGPFFLGENGIYSNVTFEQPVNGAKEGVLSITLDSSYNKLSAEISWDNRPDSKLICNLKNGINIVPLDISYKWMLNSAIDNIEIILTNPGIKPGNVKIIKAELYQRKLVNKYGLNNFRHYNLYN